MNFDTLINFIQTANTKLLQNSIKAVNVNITLRNWLIGFYIVEFEQKVEGRAGYDSNLMNELSKKITIKGLTDPELSRYHQFYNTYTNFRESLTQKFNNLLSDKILGSLSQISEIHIYPKRTKKFITHE